jgi:type I restriction enzyme R subunit
MPITPEDRARENIDKLLTYAGWIVQDKRSTNLSAGRGVAVREFPLKSGHGEADYLLFVDGVPVGVVEAKKEGGTLTGVELQTTKYSEGVPDNLTAPRRPLPFQYQSTGVETRFTNLLEPDARSRRVFSFHRPETLDQWLMQELQHPGSTLRAKLRHMPELKTDGLRSAQFAAIRNLEKSLADDRPSALIQMASGGGKTFTACNFTYRLIKHAGDVPCRQQKEVRGWQQNRGSDMGQYRGQAGAPTLLISQQLQSTHRCDRRYDCDRN